MSSHALAAGVAGCARCGLPTVAFGLLPQCGTTVDPEGHLEALAGHPSEEEAAAVLAALEDTGYGTVGST